MTTTSQKLEELISDLITTRKDAELNPSSRLRVKGDRIFAQVLDLIAPRIRHFIRQYGLVNHWEDAEQVCAIALHTAIEGYDPDKAKFTTYINWQLRGELQGLRFRLMTDQRPSAKKVGATTVSIHTAATDADGAPASLETLIEDENALDMVEAGAGAYLARGATEALIDGYIEHERQLGLKQLKKNHKPSREFRAARPDLPVGFRSSIEAIDKGEIAKLDKRLARDRDIIVRSLFEKDSQYQIAADTGLTRERVRQISRRAIKVIAAISEQDPRFRLLATDAAQPVRVVAQETRTPAPAKVRVIAKPAGEMAALPLHS